MDGLTLGRVLKLERIEKDMKQIEVAEEAGISHTYLCDIERSRQDPSMKILHKITSVLGIKVEDAIAKSNFNETGKN